MRDGVLVARSRPDRGPGAAHRYHESERSPRRPLVRAGGRCLGRGPIGRRPIPCVLGDWSAHRQQHHMTPVKVLPVIAAPGAHERWCPQATPDVAIAAHSLMSIRPMFSTSNPALEEIGRIVHEADLAGDRFDEPVAAGLDVLIRGLTLTSHRRGHPYRDRSVVRRSVRIDPPTPAHRPTTGIVRECGADEAPTRWLTRRPSQLRRSTRFGLVSAGPIVFAALQPGGRRGHRPDGRRHWTFSGGGVGRSTVSAPTRPCRPPSSHPRPSPPT
jgi:hypothetical protein